MTVKFSFLLLAQGCSPAACWQQDVAATIRMRNDGEVWANLHGAHTRTHTAASHTGIMSVLCPPVECFINPQRELAKTTHPVDPVLFWNVFHPPTFSHPLRNLTFTYPQRSELSVEMSQADKRREARTTTAIFSPHSCEELNYFQPIVIHTDMNPLWQIHVCVLEDFTLPNGTPAHMMETQSSSASVSIGAVSVIWNQWLRLRLNSMCFKDKEYWQTWAQIISFSKK